MKYFKLHMSTLRYSTKQYFSKEIKEIKILKLDIYINNSQTQ